MELLESSCFSQFVCLSGLILIGIKNAIIFLTINICQGELILVNSCDKIF